MFKKYFFKELVPDIIIALGFFLLFTGLFNLFEEDNAGSKAIVTVSEIQDTVQESEESNGELSLEPEEIVRDLSKGLEDKGLEDKGLEDKGLEDKGLEDKGLEDKGLEDKGLEDIGSEDIGSEDIGSEDIGSEDIGSEDIVENRKTEEINIIIPEGSSGRQVARIMDENNLIPFDDFIQLLLLFDIETRIKAGEYTFASDSSVIDILSRILIKERR